MKPEIKKICLSFVIFLSALPVFANQETGQKKVFLFLKEPIQKNYLSIHLKNEISSLSGNPVVNKIPQSANYSFDLLFNLNNKSKHKMTVICPQSGQVKLEAFDLFGKSIGTLFSGYSYGEAFTIEETNAWKRFTRFYGIAYLILSVDGKIVFKKLMPKVE